MGAPVDRALWFIESHFAGTVSLDAVAAVGGLSRYQMSRAFRTETGLSLRQYLRARRLSEAARALAGGAPDILAVALEAGYASHEAFSRAFRSQFGMTPAELRARRRLDGLPLVGPASRNGGQHVALPPPRFEPLGPLAIAGLGARFEIGRPAGIPALWQRVHDHLGHIPGQCGDTAYGLCSHRFAGGGEGSFYYLAGVEVSDLSAIPPELTGIRLPAQRYAVFPHEGHVSTVGATARAIWQDWLPRSGCRVGELPDMLERYDHRFDPWNGRGGLEIWLPLKD
ncbi:MAG TPA: AraC family transcriptional regulator [Alphaproteobacteria bacterium]|jgi:AraC family transcriptional regulator|nr:AraC family transcriptional regulator [Alphaproteobacteria bacterium]